MSVAYALKPRSTYTLSANKILSGLTIQKIRHSCNKNVRKKVITLVQRKLHFSDSWYFEIPLYDIVCLSRFNGVYQGGACKLYGGKSFKFPAVAALAALASASLG